MKKKCEKKSVKKKMLKKMLKKKCKRKFPILITIAHPLHSLIKGPPDMMPMMPIWEALPIELYLIIKGYFLDTIKFKQKKRIESSSCRIWSTPSSRVREYYRGTNMLDSILDATIHHHPWGTTCWKLQ